MVNPKLTNAQKAILFEKATEPPFSGQWLNNHQPGVYSCANCENQLFSAENKFDSSYGWPSFDQALEDSVKYTEDLSLGMKRIEVICSKCNGHLGHVFADGPIETTGERYCINSLALDFQKTN